MIDHWLADWPRCTNHCRQDAKDGPFLVGCPPEGAEKCPVCGGRGTVPGGLQAIERTGGPQWRTLGGFTWTLRSFLGEWRKHDGSYDAHRGYGGQVCDDVALALLRDHARERLAERGYFLSPFTRRHSITDYALYNYDGFVFRLATTDYDAALVAALLAVGGE